MYMRLKFPTEGWGRAVPSSSNLRLCVSIFAKYVSLTGWIHGKPYVTLGVSKPRQGHYSANFRWSYDLQVSNGVDKGLTYFVYIKFRLRNDGYLIILPSANATPMAELRILRSPLYDYILLMRTPNHTESLVRTVDCPVSNEECEQFMSALLGLVGNSVYPERRIVQ